MVIKNNISNINLIFTAEITNKNREVHFLSVVTVSVVIVIINKSAKNNSFS